MSKFGAILDIAIDNFSRSCFWIGALIHSENKSFLIIFLSIYCPMEEWFTLLCTQLLAQKNNDSHWKSINKQRDPRWTTIVFEKGFKNIVGFFVIGSGWSLPFFIFDIPLDIKIILFY